MLLLCCYASTTILLIYARNQANIFSLHGSLITRMYKVKTAFQNLQVKVVEHLLSFTNTIGH